MTPATVIVTGGTGFIGTQVVDQLVAAGRDVHLVSSKSASGGESVTWHEVDLHSQAQTHKLFERVEATELIHLAWYVVPGQVWNSLENLRWACASIELLRMFAASGGRRAVLAGTCSEYGSTGGVCIEEESPIAPSNLYGVSKAALASMALASAAHLGVSVAWARIFSAYGPREHPSRLVASVIRHLLLGEEAPCSTGTQRRDYLSTQQIASALIALLDSDVTGPVNVGSGEPIELRELVGRTANLIGRPELVHFGEVTPPPDDPPLLVADVARLRDEVGWRTTSTLDEGLGSTIQWWRDQLADASG